MAHFFFRWLFKSLNMTAHWIYTGKYFLNYPIFPTGIHTLQNNQQTEFLLCKQYVLQFT